MTRHVAVYPGEKVHLPGLEDTMYLVDADDGERVVLMDSRGERRVFERGDAITLRTEDLDVEGLAIPTVPIWERLYWDIRERLGW